jgi:hypothetical protein
MKSPFVQPRFEGARFAEHTLPLEVAKDLGAYETLVVEMAKHLYLQDHPERQRVLRGFGSDFHLHLEKVDDGCARPLLSLVAAGALALGVGTNTYFERARDVITDCIAAPDGQLPPSFPRELLVHFNQIGRSLRPDERMELTGPEGTRAVLSPERRKKLVLAADKVYERELELTGAIGEADWEKSTFRLRMGDGSFAVIPMPQSFHSEARKYGGQSRHQVTVKVIATFNSWDQLQKVVSTETLEVQPNYQLASRLDDLRALEDGWLDGKGKAPDQKKIDYIATRMIGRYPESLPLPAIVPTSDGNLLFEWDAQGEPSVDVRLTDMKGEFHAFGREQVDIEREFDFTVEGDWNAFLEFLSLNIVSRPA